MPSAEPTSVYGFVRVKECYLVFVLFQSQALSRSFEVLLAGRDSMNHLSLIGDPSPNESPARSTNGSEEEVNENGKILDSLLAMKK